MMPESMSLDFSAKDGYVENPFLNILEKEVKAADSRPVPQGSLGGRKIVSIKQEVAEERQKLEKNLENLEQSSRNYGYLALAAVVGFVVHTVVFIGCIFAATHPPAGIIALGLFDFIASPFSLLTQFLCMLGASFGMDRREEIRKTIALAQERLQLVNKLDQYLDDEKFALIAEQILNYPNTLQEDVKLDQLLFIAKNMQSVQATND